MENEEILKVYAVKINPTYDDNDIECIFLRGDDAVDYCTERLKSFRYHKNSKVKLTYNKKSGFGIISLGRLNTAYIQEYTVIQEYEVPQ